MIYILPKNAKISNGKGLSLKDRDNSISQDVLSKKHEIRQDDKVFIVPYIKLIGYGKNQTYQCVCCKCKKLYFNINTIRDIQDLFCCDCESDEKILEEDHYSSTNFVGTIIGWEVKSSSSEEKRRSQLNYKKVYKRDGYQCQYCNYAIGRSTEFRPLHIDHLKPWSAGGSNKMDNLVVACSKCNHHASNKWFSSFWEKKKYINQFIKEMPFIKYEIEEIK